MQITGRTVITSRLERILAILAAVVCLIVTLVIWISISAYQNMWPLPGLYFAEMVTLSMISGFLFVCGDARASLITWLAAGVITAFSILGAFSIGFFYLPVALLLVIVSIIWDVRDKQHIPAHLGLFLIAGLVQSILMLAAIPLFYPSTVF